MDSMGKLEKIEKYEARGKANKLLPLIYDADRQVSLRAIQALGKFTSRMEVMSALAQMLDNGDAEQRITAATAFSSAQGGYAESVLSHRMEQEKDVGVQEAIRESLASIKNRRS